MSANPLGMAGRLGERARKVRITRVRGWPLCSTCARLRTTGLVLANVLFWGGSALIAGALVARLITGVQSPALGAALLGGFFAALVSVVPFVLGSLPRITGARTSEDGSEVVLTSPHPAFVSRCALPAAVPPDTEPRPSQAYEIDRLSFGGSTFGVDRSVR